MRKCFPFLTTCGSQLEVIDKRHCNLLNVPDEIYRHSRSIEECFLDANQIKKLPKNFFRLSNVKVLSLSDNELSYLPENFGNFANLVDLDVSRNHIDNIHSNIKYCTHLRTLDLSSNPINRLPEGFSSLRNLTILNLNDISLTELPSDFGNLSALQKLELRDNCLKTLPNSFSRLTHLELLDLGGNEFQEYPKALMKLTELHVLCLDNNELQMLPKEIGSLLNLQQLDVSENFLESIDDSIGHLVKLTDFVLSQNSLDCLPNNIGLLKELMVLKVDQNKLMSLTSYIGECSNLQELYLTENLLQRLPGTMGKLMKLSHLNVDRNALQFIPTELTRCKQLSIMSFRSNQIRRLPDEIGEMSNLHVLDISNNLLDRLPDGIAKCPLRALWLSENQSQSIVKLQRDVDSITNEPFLTCYLLPQHHNNTDDNIPGGSGGAAVISSGDGGINTMLPSYDNAMTVATPGVCPPQTQSMPGALTTKSGYEITPPSPLAPAASQTAGSVSIHNNDDLSQLQMTHHSYQSDAGSAGDVRVRFQGNPVVVASPQNSSPIPTSYSSTGNHPLASTATIDDAMIQPSLSNRLSKEIPKSRHPKLDKRAIDGHIIPKDSHSNKDLKFAPTRIGSDSSDNGRNSSASRTKKISAPPSMAPNMSLVQQMMDCNLSVVPETANTNSNLVKRSHSDVGIDPAASSNQEQDESSGGEEIDEIARHVGFNIQSGDGEDKTASDDLKLIRRDTPHYTKKAKIQDADKSEEMVKQIMGRLQQVEPTREQMCSPNAAVRGLAAPQGMQTACRETEQVEPTREQVCSASAAARGLAAPPGMQTACRETERVHAVIDRRGDPREPLGMSVAGGLGSQPARPLFISRVVAGAAMRAGLMLNDRIIEANGQSMRDVGHEAAVAALKAGGLLLDLVVERDIVVAPPVATDLRDCFEGDGDEQVHVKFENIHAEVVRDENGLGFSIAGGKGSMRKDIGEKWAFLESIYICKINVGGAAHKCGQLEVGDKILKINGIDVSDARHNQAVVLLSGGEPSIQLEVQRQIFNGPSSTVSPTTTTNAATHYSDLVESPLVIGDGTHEQVVINNAPAPLPPHKTVDTDYSGSSQLGLSICGGCNQYSAPFCNSTGSGGLFISKLSAGGSAAATGRLRIGDRILAVNGNDVTSLTHDQAIPFFLDQGGSAIVLDVVHEPQPKGLCRVVVTKATNQRLGILIGRIDNDRDGDGDEGIFITKIIPGCVVHAYPELQVGQRIIELNNRSFIGISVASANKILTEVNTHMDIVVCDGFDPGALLATALSDASPVPDHSPTTALPSTHQTISSVDISITKQNHNVSSPPAHINNNNISLSVHNTNHKQQKSVEARRPSDKSPTSNINNNNNNNSIQQYPLSEADKFSQKSTDIDREHLSFKSKRNLFEFESNKVQKSSTKLN